MESVGDGLLNGMSSDGFCGVKVSLKFGTSGELPAGVRSGRVVAPFLEKDERSSVWIWGKTASPDASADVLLPF